MSKKAATPRNRAAQDATLINVRVLKVRVRQLERDVKVLFDLVHRLDRYSHVHGKAE